MAQTRSAWLSLAAAVVVIQALFWLQRGGYGETLRHRWRRDSLIGVAALVVGVGGLVALDAELRESVGQRLLSLVGREAETSAAASSKNERLIIWGQSVEMIGDHPLLGVGAGNWRVVIPTYGAEGLVNAKGDRVRIRPHNVYLQVADETGIPGLLLYLGIWAAAGLIAWRVIRRAPSPEDRLTSTVLLGVIVAYAVDSVFSFPNEHIEHGLYLALTWGVLLSLNERSRPDESRPTVALHRLWWILPLVVVLMNGHLAFARYGFEVYMNRANFFRKRAAPGDWAKVLEEAGRGRTPLVSLSPVGDPIELYTSQAYLGLGMLDEAEVAAERGMRYHPHSARMLNNLAAVYVQQQRLEEAIEAYEQAIEYTPEWPTALKNLAVTQFNLGRYADCLETLERVEVAGDRQLEQIRAAATSRLQSEQTGTTAQ